MCTQNKPELWKKNRFQQNEIRKTNKNEFPETGIASIANVTFCIMFQQTNIFNTTENEATDSIQTFKLDILSLESEKNWNFTVANNFIWTN